jgi:phosphoglycolate phosphatase
MRLPDLAAFRHVVWDWNGTLFDDAWLCVEVMSAMLSSRGLPALPSERYQEVFGFPVRDYYRRVGFDFAREPFEEVGAEFIAGYRAREHACLLQPGAAEALGALAARGLSMSVLSASEERALEAQARRLGVRERFAQVLGRSDPWADGKLEMGRRLLLRLGGQAREVLLVGDTDHDHEVARELGLGCVLIPSGHQSARRLSALGVPVVASLEELAALMA